MQRMIRALQELEGEVFAGRRGSVERRPGRFREEVIWRLIWDRRVVAVGLAFAGRGAIPPWLDFDFFPPPSWERTDLARFWRWCARTVGEGGRVMVGYEHLPETLAALQRGVPPILTPLGEALREAGFWSFKDWYYPEGWAEGGRKLQAERPRAEDLERQQVLRKWEVREALPHLYGEDRDRALRFLRTLPFRVRMAGLYLVTDPHYLPTPDHWLTRIPAAFAGGVDVFQLRTKARRDLDAAVGEALREEARRWGVEFVVNDDPARARDLGAEGVHLGRDDPPIETAREVFSGYVGVSAYNDLHRARDLVQRGADYVALGSVFPSPTEPHRVRVSPDVVYQAWKTLHVPIVVIGGINETTLPELLAQTRVDAVAVVSAVLGAQTPEEVRTRAQRLKALLSRSLRRHTLPPEGNRG